MRKHLGGKIGMMMTFDQMPDPKMIPPGCGQDSVLHAQIAIGDTLLMASDGPPMLQPMRSAYLALSGRQQ